MKHKVTNEELWEKANAGDEFAQSLVCEILVYGSDGFKQDLGKLMELAEQGWKQAQFFILWGIREGCYGFEQDRDKANELKKKWKI